MKKTNFTNFDAPVVASNPHFIIQSDEYLNQLLINKIVIYPLQRIEGNTDDKARRDTCILILSGSGSMEVNGSSAPVNSGDVVYIKASESFSVINDTLDAILQFVSVLSKK